MFNDGDFVGRAKRGEIGCYVRYENHPTSPKARVPYCTKSQLLGYYDRNGRLLATAHQYLKPDGSLGASGLPDPKKVLQGDEYYVGPT